HAVTQRARYEARRSVLADAFTAAGWTIDHSEAGLYLWVTHPGYDCWEAAEVLATSCGILTAPGALYGPGGDRHVRVALTATDSRVAAAAAGIGDLAETGLLRPPSSAPVFYANAIDQAGPDQQVYTDRYGNPMYGQIFNRARWRQE
ncbi:MAG TPA: aminotransferase class I/II-fold pyridoxal phosphate-dependent enzyme, partial [Streptosporangiaceae bacterium]